MRIQINDRDGNTRTITSKNLVLIGAWVAETLPDCMTNNPAMMKDVKLYVTPETYDERQVLPGTEFNLTSSSLMALSNALKIIAEQLLKTEIESPY
jgi:hypothetical protein